jgi:alginate O-acetyltransferase complex protein AlgI
LVAGPIVRASDFLPQLDEKRNINLSNFKIGIQIFSFGLFKKIVIADWLSVFVDDVFRTPNAFHAISLMLAVIAYSIQIYFDFSGYSDMTIGCAKCLGYDFARNFNLPYISRNITEFWRRWHISLSSWLKEYLYIPLGGNRKGNIRTYINNMITMLLGGLWHGANWTFLAWGGAHGIVLRIHKIYKKYFTPSPPPAHTIRFNMYLLLKR